MARMMYISRGRSRGSEQEPGRESTSPYYQRQEEYRRSGFENGDREYGNSRRDPMEDRRYDGRVQPIGFVPSMRYGGSETGWYSPYSHYGSMGDKEGRMQSGGAYSRRQEEQQPLSRRDAEAWVHDMKAADGSRMPAWDPQEAEELVKRQGYQCDPLDVWVGMNALYADLCAACADHGITKKDTEFWMDIAVAFWLCDEDAVEEKLAAYYRHIVE